MCGATLKSGTIDKATINTLKVVSRDGGKSEFQTNGMEIRGGDGTDLTFEDLELDEINIKELFSSV
jgi:hypothetical protein